MTFTTNLRLTRVVRVLVWLISLPVIFFLHNKWRYSLFAQNLRKQHENLVNGIIFTGISLLVDALERARDDEEGRDDSEGFTAWFDGSPSSAEIASF